jgi:hypothetical protein
VKSAALKIATPLQLRAVAKKAAADARTAKLKVRAAKAALKTARKHFKAAKKAAKQARKKLEILRSAPPRSKTPPAGSTKSVRVAKSPPPKAAPIRKARPVRKSRAAPKSKRPGIEPMRTAAEVAKSVIERLHSAPPVLPPAALMPTESADTPKPSESN